MGMLAHPLPSLFPFCASHLVWVVSSLVASCRRSHPVIVVTSGGTHGNHTGVGFMWVWVWVQVGVGTHARWGVPDVVTVAVGLVGE